jgi:hypothetical protein
VNNTIENLELSSLVGLSRDRRAEKDWYNQVFDGICEVGEVFEEKTERRKDEI